MIEKKKALKYTLGAVRRQVNEAFPDLQIHFVIYDSEKPNEEQKKSRNLPDHPARQAAQEILDNDTSSETRIIALTISSKKPIPFLKKKEEFLALCQIDIRSEAQKRERIFPDNPEKYDRTMAYTLAWKALDLLRQYKESHENENKNSPPAYTIDKNTIRPAKKQAEKLRANLLSECFATMLMEQQGEAGIIQQFMKQRCKRSISKIKNSSPEDAPFPIAFDATRIIFKGLNASNSKNTNLIKHTLSMTDEISNTCDDITLRQWRTFCYAAQEMAWMGSSKNEILSAATYTSDDAHMRTTAYIIAEALNTDVIPLNNPQFYNPFADQEKYNRLHHKAANSLFEDLMKIAEEEGRPEILLQHALTQNKSLFEGKIIGWCAPALVKTCNAYSNKGENSQELLHDIFQNVLKDTKWSDICELNRFIMLKKREETPVTSDIILKEYIGNREERKFFAEAFSAL